MNMNDENNRVQRLTRLALASNPPNRSGIIYDSIQCGSLDHSVLQRLCIHFVQPGSQVLSCHPFSLNCLRDSSAEARLERQLWKNHTQVFYVRWSCGLGAVTGLSDMIFSLSSNHRSPFLCCDVHLLMPLLKALG